MNGAITSAIGLAMARSCTCPAVRIKVVSEFEPEPVLQHRADLRLEVGCLAGRGEERVPAVGEAADLVEAERLQETSRAVAIGTLRRPRLTARTPR